MYSHTMEGMSWFPMFAEETSCARPVQNFVAPPEAPKLPKRPRDAFASRLQRHVCDLRRTPGIFGQVGG